MTNDWFYINSLNKEEGPIPKETLEIMLEDGVLKPRTIVWAKTLPYWMPALEVEQLSWKRPREYSFVENFRNNRVFIKEHAKPPRCLHVEKIRSDEDRLTSMASLQYVGSVIWLFVGLSLILTDTCILLGLLNIIWATAAFSVGLRLSAGDQTVKRFLANPLFPALLLGANIFLAPSAGILAVMVDIYIRYEVGNFGRLDVNTSPVAYDTL